MAKQTIISKVDNENPNVKIFHTRAIVSDDEVAYSRLHGFQVFPKYNPLEVLLGGPEAVERLKSEVKNREADDWIIDVSSIPGVQSIAAAGYALTVSKAEAFDWDEIEGTIVERLKLHFPELRSAEDAPRFERKEPEYDPTFDIEKAVAL